MEQAGGDEQQVRRASVEWPGPALAEAARHQADFRCGRTGHGSSARSLTALLPPAAVPASALPTSSSSARQSIFPVGRFPMLPHGVDEARHRTLRHQAALTAAVALPTALFLPLDPTQGKV